MKNIILRDLKENLSRERYDHTLRVVETGKKLAKAYNLDVARLEIATLLHDIGKCDDLNIFINDYGNLNIEENIDLYHGKIGAMIANKRYKIKDKEILDSIEYHTTGRENMSVFEKIVYLSDYIEPKRKHDGIEEIRETAYTDIDRSLLMALDKTIVFVIERKLILGENTVKARNYLLKQKIGVN